MQSSPESVDDPVDLTPDTLRTRLMAATALLQVNELDAAIRALEALVDAAPEQPMPRYRLAVAYARAGQRERALANLAGAVEAGFRQPEVLEAEPGFAGYRASATYSSSLELTRHNQHPCADDPARRAFDFFIGDWQVTTPDGVPAGTNRIEAVLGGAALIERWASTHGYEGTSLNRLDPVAGTWCQTWVDDQGDVTEFVDGHLDGDAMRFVAHGNGVERRLSFFPEGLDALRQLSEISTDGGVTWAVEYDLRYRRRPLTRTADTA